MSLFSGEVCEGGKKEICPAAVTSGRGKLRTHRPVRCVRKFFPCVLYDLAFYPAATKGRGEEVFAPLKAARTEALPVYVSYEYGGLDEGQEFDP